ncbi:hypothetical protein SDC9_187548 [bioreactor metagenome]|uniref:Uncharacterized protein n=1 Tax=bioreactor metagenome TaxID=1076179 RepID=A0A645HXG3_9ZZZZ
MQLLEYCNDVFPFLIAKIFLVTLITDGDIALVVFVKGSKQGFTRNHTFLDGIQNSFVLPVKIG